MRWHQAGTDSRSHGTTGEAPAVRFARDEQAALRPLAARPYRSLVLVPEPRPAPAAPLTRAAVPAVPVERRALASYADLVAEAGADYVAEVV